MPSNNNVLDISVLRSNPAEFLLRCQRIIHICVKQYIASGMFDPEDEQDMIQTINERLIVKLPVIEAQYSGIAQMNTYMNAIIQHICIKINRESNKDAGTAPLHTAMSHLSNDPTNDVFIHEELQRFHSILQLFYGKKYKILFFVRLYLGIQMKGMEIRDIIRDITVEERKMVSEKIINNYHQVSVPARFEIITELVNKYRTYNYGKNKKISDVALLRWTQRKTSLMIRLLNGNPPTRFYTEETLKLLIEEYYIRKN